MICISLLGCNTIVSPPTSTPTPTPRVFEPPPNNPAPTPQRLIKKPI